MSSLSAVSTLPASDDAWCAAPGPAAAPRGDAGPRRGERVLVAAFLLSLLLHLLGASGAADWQGDLFRYEESDPGPPLRAVLKPPPPPVYHVAVKAPPPKLKPRPRPRPVPPPVSTAPAISEPEAPAVAAVPLELESQSSAAPLGAAPTAPAPEPHIAPAVETPAAPQAAAEPAAEPATRVEAPSPVSEKPAPRIAKRIDLVGTLFVGDQNFMVGTGGFRLRHDGNRYEISVLGQSKGLARLLFAGAFSGVSRGAITPGGLQPSEYMEERGRSDKREYALLDWEAGVIRLRDDKVVALEPPVFDRLSVIMQFYYRPPESTELSMRVAGTRDVDTWTFRRTDSERLELPFGTADTHVWRSTFANGDPRIDIWMSPEYHYLPLRIRVHARKEFGGRNATLHIDEIRVED